MTPGPEQHWCGGSWDDRRIPLRFAFRVLQACEILVGHDFGPAGDDYGRERVEAGLIKMPMSDIEAFRQ